MRPPLVDGVVSAEGEPKLRVTGRVAGRRGVVDRLDVFSFGLRDLMREAWGQLVLRIADEKAGVEFSGTGWSPRVRPDVSLRVRHMKPDPVPWLKDYLSAAGRRLDAESSVGDPPSAEAAWRLARLRLVFGDAAGATLAVQHGLDHLARIRGAGVDRDDLRLLDKQLRRCGCRDAAAELRAYVEDLPV